jgi:hypothetical protein
MLSRTAVEIATRVLSTHAFAVFNYSHLETLLNLPNEINAINTFFFPFYPTLVLVQPLLGMLNAIRYRKTQCDGSDGSIKPSSSFLLCGIMGMRATVSLEDFPDSKFDNLDPDNPPTVPLFTAGYQSLRRTTYSLSRKWLEHVLTTLLTLSHSIAAIIIYYRRLQNNSALTFDHCNGIISICSFFTSLLSLLVLLPRYSWQLTSPPTNNSQSGPLTTTILCQLALAFLAIIPFRRTGFLAMLISLSWISKFTVVVIVIYLLIFALRRREIYAFFKRLGGPTEWIVELSVRIVAVLAVFEIEWLLWDAVGELAENFVPDWRDPVSGWLLFV